MKRISIIICLLLLIGCSDHRTITFHVVASIGDCIEGTGGWGGEAAKCRAVFEDGKKATIYRPLDVGDRVRCTSNPPYPYTFCVVDSRL